MGQDTRALLQSISAYVPGLIVGRAISTARPSPLGRGERMHAALLFADVSGFTAMSESLARLGKEGAEELTRVLNTYFATMIDLVRSYGGQVCKFGGDAITCAFTSPRIGTSAHRQILNLQTEVLRACGCALAMQERTVAFRAVETRGGVFELRMKIGISAGPVLFLSVGDPQEGLDYVLAGRPLDRMAEAEHHAAAGEVVVDGGCLAQTGMGWEEAGIIADIIVGQERDGYLLVRGLTQPAGSVEEDGFDWDSLSEEAAEQAVAHLVPYLPPAVYAQIAGGQREFVGEHRRVVSLFVNFIGLDYDADPEVGQRLQRYFTTMQGIIHRYGGRLNRAMTGDKGSLLHLIFGAPVTHEDNEERALRCALEMQRAAVGADCPGCGDDCPGCGEGGLPFITDQRIGIGSGHVFAGNVGSERRREYTVMGDAVNLSARLMQAAGAGEILLDRDTARQVEETFICEELAPIHVKGKRKPIPVYRATGAREEARAWEGERARARRRESPIVGRERELDRIEAIVGRAAAGRGQLLVIAGEAGVGKSRLLEELIVLAHERGAYGLEGDCPSYGSQSPYLPWIDILTSFFGLTAEESEGYEGKVHRIERRMIQADPALGDWAPLMGQLLGLPVPDNALTGSLDAQLRPQLRQQRTFDITLALLRHQAQQVGLLLMVFEDVHWIDAISLEMLNHVARNVADHRILLVALHRPTVELAEWARHDHYNRIELTDLPAEDALEMVRLKLGMNQVPAPLREHVLQGEARVNPFFLEEMINSLVDSGYLGPREGAGYDLAGDLSQVEIPDSVQALVMSRIDRLDESTKLTVKVASVIGRTFKYRPLAAIYPVPITPERLRANLDRLSRLDLTPLDRPAPEWEYIFKHVTTQEVAYESLLYAHRRELHHRMGEYLERTYRDRLEEVYELLAHHYYQSGDPEKSWDYLVKAGDKARDRYANEAAIAHYEQALSLEDRREGVEGVYESLGDVYRLVGRYEHALASYRQALESHPPTAAQVAATAAQVAEVRRKIARTWGRQGRYDEANRYLDLARSALDEGQATPEMARIYSDMGWVAMRRGDYQEALQRCASGLDVAGRLPRLRGRLPGDEKGHQVKARLQHTLGSIYWQTGDYPRAIAHFQECIEVQKSSGDLYRLSGSYNNLAAVYWSQSDYDLAAEYIRKSLEIHRKIGNTYGTAVCANNLGVIAYTLGDYPSAIEHYERSLAIRKEIGDRKGIADIYNNLGEVHHSLGDCHQALEYLTLAVEISTQIGDKTGLVDPYRLLAEVELELGDVAKAVEYCQLALRTAQEVGNREYEGVAYRVLGQIHRVDGRPEEARRCLEESVEKLMTTGNRLELGRSTYELGLALATMGLDEGRERLQQAVQIFAELGVEGELEKARAALGDR